MKLDKVADVTVSMCLQ